MNRIPIKTLCLTILFWGSFSPLSLAQEPIAHYPLNSSPDDTTGNYGPMILTNTPFQDGGIYCNGIYISSGDSNYCHAVTPEIDALSFQSLTLSAEFKVTEAYTIARPVFVGGTSIRWLAFFLTSDTTVALGYDYILLSSNVRYSVNTWHQATITFDSTARTARYYLDGLQAGTAQLDLLHGNERHVGITHFGYNNAVFKGILRNLKIFSAVIIPTSAGGTVSTIPEEFALSQNYPNPFNPITSFEFQVARTGFVDITVFDLTGRTIAAIVSQELQPGTYRQTWDASSVSSGIYFYQMRAGTFVDNRKMAVVR